MPRPTLQAIQRRLGVGTAAAQKIQKAVDHYYECGCYWYCGNIVACDKHKPTLDRSSKLCSRHLHIDVSTCAECAASRSAK